MSLSRFTRHARVLGAALILWSLAGTIDAQSIDPLFTDTPSRRAPDVAAPSEARPFVVRSRTADLQSATLKRALTAPATTAFALNLFDDVRLPVTFERMEEHGADRRTWVGHITDRPHSSVILTLSTDFVAGQILDGTTIYEIGEYGSGVHRIDQLDTTKMSRPRDQVRPVPESSAAAAMAAAQARARAAARDLSSPAAAPSVDVLIYYSPGVRAQTGGGAQAAALAERLIAEANAGFAASGITGRVRLVGAVEVPAPDGADQDLLVDVLSTHPAIIGQRNAVGTDLVMLLVTHVSDPNLCGLAYLGPSSELGFGLASTRSECYLTFTHELGHNLGGQHSPNEPVDHRPQYPAYARAYQSPIGTFRTVMSYDCPALSGCPVLLNFSNPNVAAPPPLAPGQPTGTPAQNNARRVHEVFPAVANYRVGRIAPSPPLGLTAAVGGATVTLAWRPPAAGSSPTDYVLVAGRTPGTANIVPGAAIGDTAVTVGGVPAGQYFVRVHARNGGGISAPSNEVMFTVGLSCTLPSAPRNFAATKAGNHLSLSWAPPAVGGPSSYIVQAGSAPGAANLFNANIGGGTTIGAGVPNGTYYVRVFAMNACGVGPASPEGAIAIP